MKFSLTRFQNELTSAVLRFPVPTLTFALICALAQADIFAEQLHTSPRDYLILATVAQVFLLAQLVAEARRRPAWQAYAFAAPVSLALTWLLSQPAGTILSLTPGYFQPALFWAMASLPFLFNTGKKHDTSLWQANYRIATQTLGVGVVGGVLCLGIFSIFGSLSLLFDIHVGSKAYSSSAVFIFTLISPLLWLSGLPHPVTSPKTLPAVPHDFILKVLRYVIIPLLVVYAVILHAYVLKILVETSLPRGGVAQLVSGLSTTTLLTLLASYTARRHDNILRLFHTWAPVALVAPLLLMGFGIAERITSYGFTPERYLLLISFIWLSVSVGMALSPLKTYLPRVALVTLALLLGITSVEAIGPRAISTASQSRRLHTLLAENHMLSPQGHILPARPDLAPQARSNIIASVYALQNLHAQEQMRPLFVSLPQAALNASGSQPDLETILADMGIACRLKYSGMQPACAEEGGRTKQWNGTVPTYGAIIGTEGYGFVIPHFNLGPRREREAHATQEIPFVAKFPYSALRLELDETDMTLHLSLTKPARSLTLNLKPQVEKLLLQNEPKQGEGFLLAETSIPGMRARAEIYGVTLANLTDKDGPRLTSLYGKVMFDLTTP